MAGKSKVLEKVYRMVYVKIADVLLFRKAKLGGDGCLDPDCGRAMCAAATDAVMPFITTLEMMLHYLENRGYVGFKFEQIEDPYYRYSFQAWKKGFTHNFSGGGEIDRFDPLCLPTFKGKSKYEAVFHALISENPPQELVNGF